MSTCWWLKVSLPRTIALAAATVSLDCVMGGALRAQSRSAAGTEYTHEFTTVSAVRVLRDGRVLVADRREKRLVILGDPSADGVTVGRNGNGPLEYQVPGQLIALGGDSTLMTDAQTGRWHLLAGASITASAPVPDALMKAVSTYPLIGRDAQHRLYWLAGLPPSDPSRRVLAPGMIEEADSMVVLRRSPAGSTTDTLARLKGPFGGRNMVPRVVLGVKSVYMLHALLRSPDQVALCDDGWMAVLRVDVPRVDWIRPDGRIALGARLAVPRRPVTGRDKQQAIVEFMGERVAPYFKESEFPGWPATVPAYAASGIHCSPRGEALLTRFGTTSAPTLVDRVDRAGRIAGTHQLPPNATLKAATRADLVLVVRDADDVERLVRVPHNTP